MPEYLTYTEIADRLGVSIDTVRRSVKRLSKSHDIKPLYQKTPTSKGTRVYCLSIDDANALFSWFEDRSQTESEDPNDLASFQRYGYFYIIQLVPELMPQRVKIGYTDSLETRLNEHQTSAPTSKFVKTWECKRSWDQAAMDSITRGGCELIMNEVYEGNIDGFIERGNAFFTVMPKRDNKVPLSKHSPLNENSG
jgi:hypothetical protein